MATAYYTPGVYIEEVDKGTKPIQGVSTSVTAFIGFTAKAEKKQADGITTRSILGEPTLVTNWGQYTDLFGAYDKNAYLPYAVRGFFDNGGTRCYIVSVRATEQHRAHVVVSGSNHITGDSASVLLIRAAKGGIKGNDLCLEIRRKELTDANQQSGDEKGKKGQTPSGKDRLQASGANQQSGANNNKKEENLSDDERKKTFFVLTTCSKPTSPGQGALSPLAKDARNSGRKAQLEQKRAALESKWQGKDSKVDLAASLEQLADKIKEHPDLQQDKNDWDQAQTELSAQNQAADHASQESTLPEDSTSFEFEFCMENLPSWFDMRAENMQYRQWTQLTKTEKAKKKERGEAPLGSLIDQKDKELPIEVWKIHKRGREATIWPKENTPFVLQRGSLQFDHEFSGLELLSLPTTEMEQTAAFVKNSKRLYEGDETKRKGVDGLFAFDEINLICAPDLMKMYDPEVMRASGLDTTKADGLVAGLQETILTFCKKAHYPFAILDAPPKKDVQSIGEWRMALPGADTMHGALYYPWIKITDPFDAKRQIEIPPSGHIAGIYARSDNQRGVFKAPANEIVSGAVDLQLNVTKNEQELLNPIGVNCIRAFPGRGIRIWGARTLAMTDPSWRYINVRRLFSYVEASIERSTQWVVFEPNDHILWAKVRRDVTAFLRTVWLSGALFGLTPEEAFYVKCDEETNLPELRDLGQMVCEIGMAPVKPAEFVIFRFSQWTSEANTAS